MGLLEKIDEITANSVTPEEFKETWGYSIDEHVEDMMDRIHKLEAEEAPAQDVVAAESRILRAASPAAKKAASKKKGETAAEVLESKTIAELARKVAELLKKMGRMKEFTDAGKIVTLAEPQRGKKKRTADAWELKLVAVQTGTGKTLAAGAPVIIQSVDSPREERFVARVYSPKTAAGVKPGTVELKGLESAKMIDSVKGLMVDVGDLVGVEPQSRCPKKV